MCNGLDNTVVIVYNLLELGVMGFIGRPENQPAYHIGDGSHDDWTHI